MPDDIFIEEKLKAYKKYADIDIDSKNVFKFDYTKESLEKFVNSFEAGKMKVGNADKAIKDLL
jgi:hypothetical protein